MTNYGEDLNPDLNIARQVLYGEKLMPLDDSFVTQWQASGGKVMRQLSNKIGKSKILILMDD